MVHIMMLNDMVGYMTQFYFIVGGIVIYGILFMNRTIKNIWILHIGFRIIGVDILRRR